MPLPLLLLDEAAPVATTDERVSIITSHAPSRHSIAARLGVTLMEAMAKQPHCTASAVAAVSTNGEGSEDDEGWDGGWGLLLLTTILVLLLVTREVCSRTASRSTAQASSSREK